MTPSPAPPTRCPRLVSAGGAARRFCDRAAGADGVCRRHRYTEKQQRAERDRRHAALVARRASHLMLGATR